MSAYAVSSSVSAWALGSINPPVHCAALQQAGHRLSKVSCLVTTDSQVAHCNGGVRQNRSYTSVNRVVTGFGKSLWAIQDSLGGKGYRDRRVYFQCVGVATPGVAH
jgi:hypothetical protein